MQFILLLIGALLCYGMVLQAIIWFWRSSQCATITDLPFRSGMHAFEISKPGLHVVKVVGAYRLSGALPLRITRTDTMVDRNVPQWVPALPFTGYQNGKRTVDALYFHARKEGRYALSIGDASSLKAHLSQLRLMSLAGAIPNSSLTIRVAQSIPSWQRLLAMIFLGIGLNGAAWCTIFLFWPDAFG